MNPCTQITIRFSAKLRIESGNYETPVFIYSKIEKKKFNINLLLFFIIIQITRKKNVK